MCFVLDANSFHRFFNPFHPEYCEFEPLHDWLYKKNGTKLVYGGSDYIREIDCLKRYGKYLKELKDVSKFKKINTVAVDAETERIKAAINDHKCNDHHIIALLAVSGCLLFASHDAKADKYIKNQSLYPNGKKRSIYRYRQHADLLSKEKIVKLQNVEI